MLLYRYLTSDYSRIKNVFDAYSTFIIDSIIDECMNDKNIKAVFLEHYNKYKECTIHKQRDNQSKTKQIKQ